MYKLKDYGDGNIEVMPESLEGTKFEYLAVRCSDPCMQNMSDDDLKEDDEKYNGDGREMKFNIFVDHSYNACLAFNFNLYGIDVRYTISPHVEDSTLLEAINEVIVVVNEYFKDIWLDDISEAFYKKFENEILIKILDYDKERALSK